MGKGEGKRGCNYFREKREPIEDDFLCVNTAAGSSRELWEREAKEANNDVPIQEEGRAE